MTTPAPAGRYRDEVEKRLSDLDAAARADIVSELEGHLAELSLPDYDAIVARLGDPRRYATELRAAAGLPATRENTAPAPPAARRLWPFGRLATSLAVVGAFLFIIALLAFANQDSPSPALQQNKLGPDDVTAYVHCEDGRTVELPDVQTRERPMPSLTELCEGRDVVEPQN